MLSCRGGELASIHSEGENNFTHYHTQGVNGFYQWWWIGLYKDDTGRLFKDFLSFVTLADVFLFMYFMHTDSNGLFNS